MRGGESMKDRNSFPKLCSVSLMGPTSLLLAILTLPAYGEEDGHNLRRNYYLPQPLFWGGSGDGPILTDVTEGTDGGLAWDDNTPTIKVEGTPSYHPITPTRTTTVTVEPTAFVPFPPSEADEKKGEATIDFWVQTTLRANESALEGRNGAEMQKRLARIYASAFKRHLLSSLGVFKGGKEPEFRRRRRRIRESFTAEVGGGNERPDFDFELLVLGQRVKESDSRFAEAATNVTVSILNHVVEGGQQLRVSYVVCADGSPIKGASAVHDLRLVSKREMENEIGYEVIRKAEALVSEEERGDGGGKDSTWLIIAISTMCVLAVILLLSLYIMWRLKYSRVGRPASPPPTGGMERNVIRIVGSIPSSPRHPQQLGVEAKRGRWEGKEESSSPPPDSRRRREEQEAFAAELGNLLRAKKPPVESYQEEKEKREAKGQGSFEDVSMSREGSGRSRGEENRIGSEKISLGNLDLVEGGVARNLSAAARRVLREESSSAGEQDRDLSEDSGGWEREKRRGRRRKKGGKKPPSTDSLLSTGSEESVTEVRVEAWEGNPLGRMRTRFHQFLDDAFNTMGKKEGEVEAGRAKSAKVSISHEITKRPGSAGDQLRTDEPASEEVGGPTFPGYPVYPELVLGGSPTPTAAGPLIQVIKEEIRRFEKLKEPR